MALTLSNIRTQALINLQDDGTRWPTAELNFYANKALREFCRRVPVLRKIITLANASSYDTDRPYAFYNTGSTKIVMVRGVWSAGLRLTRTTVDEELDRGAAWEDQTGTPERYIHGDFGVGLFRVCSYPAAALTTLRALVSYLDITLSSDGDTPTIPDQYQDVLVDYVTALAFARGGADQNLTEAARYGQTWEAAIVNAQDDERQGFDDATRTVPADWF